MGSGKILSASEHVAGYCKPSSLDGGVPTPDSFRIDDNGISVNHLEWFDKQDLDAAILGLQKFNCEREDFETRRTGKIAGFVVGRIRSTGADVVIDRRPSNPSHALIQNISDSALEFKAKLLRLIEFVRPAWPPT